MSFNVIKLGQLLATLTDYHANGAYKALKENVELLDTPDYALMIRTTNFENDDFTDSVKYISKSAYNFLSKSKVYPTDIIMNKIANAGSVYLMPDLSRPVSLAMNLFLLRVDNSKANPIYVYIFLKINESYVKQFANGSVTKTITKDAVRNLDIVLPPRAEQDKIARSYQIISNKINNNNKINHTLEQMAQALFKSWFVDFEPVKAKIAELEAGGSQEDATLAAMTAISGKDADALAVFERKHPEQYAELKATAELFPSAMQEGALGATPTGWKLGCIGDISHRIRTKVGSTSAVVLSAIASGDLVPSDEHFTKQVYSKSIEKYILVEQWSFAYNPSRINIGSIGLNVRNVNGAVSPVYVVFKTEQEYKWYVEILTKTTYFKNNVNILASGSVRQSLSYDDLSSIPLCIPDVSIVNVFNEKYEGYLTFIEQYRNQNNTLISIRDTLLPKLLSGEITLPEAEQAVSEAENV
ncbi:restriction endonuclease subunit S [Enterobacter mori]